MPIKFLLTMLVLLHKTAPLFAFCKKKEFVVWDVGLKAYRAEGEDGLNDKKIQKLNL